MMTPFDSAVGALMRCLVEDDEPHQARKALRQLGVEIEPEDPRIAKAFASGDPALTTRRQAAVLGGRRS